MLFISFSYLIAMARTFNTMLNRSHENDCVFPEFRENDFSFLPLIIMATHSSVLAWRIPWTGEPGGLSSMGSDRVGHD